MGYLGNQITNTKHLVLSLAHSRCSIVMTNALSLVHTLLQLLYRHSPIYSSSQSYERDTIMASNSQMKKAGTEKVQDSLRSWGNCEAEPGFEPKKSHFGTCILYHYLAFILISKAIVCTERKQEYRKSSKGDIKM